MERAVLEFVHRHLHLVAALHRRLVVPRLDEVRLKFFRQIRVHVWDTTAWHCFRLEWVLARKRLHRPVRAFPNAVLGHVERGAVFALAQIGAAVYGVFGHLRLRDG